MPINTAYLLSSVPCKLVIVLRPSVRGAVSGGRIQCKRLPKRVNIGTFFSPGSAIIRVCSP